MSSTDEWIKMWYTYTMEYYSAIKRNKIVSFAETWIDLETVIQSKVSQKEKNKYSMLTHICLNSSPRLDPQIIFLYVLRGI